MLRAYKQGDAPAEFEAYWEDVRQFRMKVPADVETLKKEAEERVASGEQDVQLDYPAYPAFSWERKSSE